MAGKTYNILVITVTLQKLLTAKPGCGGDAPRLRMVARLGAKRRSSTGKTGRNCCGILLHFSAKQEVIFSLAHAVNFSSCSQFYAVMQTSPFLSLPLFILSLNFTGIIKSAL